LRAKVEVYARERELAQLMLEQRQLESQHEEAARRRAASKDIGRFRERVSP